MTRNESNWNPWIKIEPQGVSAVNRRLNRGKKLVNRNDRIRRSDHLTLISFIGRSNSADIRENYFWIYKQKILKTNVAKLTDPYGTGSPGLTRSKCNNPIFWPNEIGQFHIDQDSFFKLNHFILKPGLKIRSRSVRSSLGQLLLPTSWSSWNGSNWVKLTDLGQFSRVR